MAQGLTVAPRNRQVQLPLNEPAVVADTSPAAQRMSLFQLINLSVGFLGIQFAWSLQMGHMSPLLESLGSDPRLTGLIWSAGPVTGVLVQPIVGALSDECRLALGRRRPFLLLGALLTGLSLVLMPNSINLLMAALLLWVLDASINMTQGPYRALVPDVVPKAQQATAYALMSLTIGLGSVAAFLVGYVMHSVHQLFYLGAMVMIMATLWTVIKTPEKQKQDAVVLTPQRLGNPFITFCQETWRSIVSMSGEGKKLCVAHSFTWFGLMCLFVYFSLYVPHHIFGAQNTQDPLYQQGVQWASLCYAVLNLVCFLFSGVIGKLCKLSSKKMVHTLGLLCMVAGFLSLVVLTTPVQAMLAMAAIGVGWATTLSIPFALLSDYMPEGKEGVMMGTFNIFIAAPGVISTLVVGQVVQAFGNQYTIAMILGGISILISMLLLQRLHEKPRAQTI